MKRSIERDGVRTAPSPKRRKLNPNFIRPWIPCKTKKSFPTADPKSKFKVMTYNVDDNLEKSLPQIFDENADVICLQEVSNFPKYLSEFEKNGYEGCNVSRVEEDLSTCTFWKTSRFIRCQTSEIQSMETSQSDDTALVVALMDKTRTPVSISTHFGAHLIVSNVHCPSHFSKGRKKLILLEELFQEVKLLKKVHSGASVIFAGDFNFVPHSILYGFMEKGRLITEETDWNEICGTQDVQVPAEAEIVEAPTKDDMQNLSFTGRWIKNKVDMRSHTFGRLQCVYSEKDITSKAFITSWAPTLRFKADYIWTNLKDIVPVSRLELPTQRQIQSCGGFHSESLPSDHIMLLSELNYRQKTETNVEPISKLEGEGELGLEVTFGGSDGKSESESQMTSSDEDESISLSTVAYFNTVKKLAKKGATKCLSEICKKAVQRQELTAQDKRVIDSAVGEVTEVVKKMNRKFRKLQHKIEIFGSQRMQLATKKSDVDIVLLPLYTRKYDPVDVLSRIADEVYHKGQYLSVDEEIYSARCPIVILDYDEKVKVDLSVKGRRTSPIKAVEFIQKECQKHPLVRPFLLLVKEWAKRMYVCDAFKGTINSFCWVNVGIWSLKMTFTQDINIHKAFGLGDLLLMFFHNLLSVNFAKQGICSRTGQRKPKKHFMRQNSMVVLDPTTPGNNLAQNCKFSGLTRIKKLSKSMLKKLNNLDNYDENMSFAALIS